MLWRPHDISYNTPRRNRGAHHQPIGQRLCVPPQLRTNMSCMGTSQSLSPLTCRSNDDKVIMGRARRLLPSQPQKAAPSTILSHSPCPSAVYVAPRNISLFPVQDAPQSSSLGNTGTGRGREGSAEGILPSDHAHSPSLLPHHRATHFVHTIPVVDRLRPTPLVHPPPACTRIHGNPIHQSDEHLINGALCPSAATLASVDPTGEQVQTHRESGVISLRQICQGKEVDGDILPYLLKLTQPSLQNLVLRQRESFRQSPSGEPNSLSVLLASYLVSNCRWHQSQQ